MPRGSDQAYGWRSDRVRGRIAKKGRVVGSFFVEGMQVRGESQVEFEDAVLSASEEESEALEKTKIPRKYRKYVRDYFDMMTPGER